MKYITPRELLGEIGMRPLDHSIETKMFGRRPFEKPAKTEIEIRLAKSWDATVFAANVDWSASIPHREMRDKLREKFEAMLVRMFPEDAA